MAYEPKDGDCAVFFNDKRGNDNAPDRRGYVILHRDAKRGERLEVALWEKQPRGGGAPFLGGKVSDPRKPQQASKPAPRRDEPPSGLDDDIPF